MAAAPLAQPSLSTPRARPPARPPAPGLPDPWAQASRYRDRAPLFGGRRGGRGPHPAGLVGRTPPLWRPVHHPV